jgi:hypothetical protein
LERCEVRLSSLAGHSALEQLMVISFTTRRRVLVYRFASAANRDDFLADRYGQIYLNVGPEAATCWQKDISVNLAKPNEDWPKIKSTPAAQLNAG